ncbi:MAG: 3-hydroxyacyl-ACP dehydratase [Deltaproteobacteria bacterium]|nr:3-hydroxyacyl-ACP dehydratase [Deltaproteobacteria bacterium]
MILGIDIGSRSIEVVGLCQGEVTATRQAPTTFDPVAQVRRLLDGLDARRIVATGYGRKLVQDMDLGCPVDAITEIKAHGLGAHHRFPQGRTVLDIGGQDTKALALLPGGRVAKFEMNDRCAAGTGKFLEYTAQIFQIPIPKFGAYALDGDNPPIINSMCTVFAETEATSLMAQGVRPENIALGLHLAIARRTVNMLNRVGLTPPLVFVGGVAHNPCMRVLLAEQTGTVEGETLLIPDEPDMTGALGAALWGETLAE